MKELNVTIIATTDCNLKCTYCINHSGEDLKNAMCHQKRNWNNSMDVISLLGRIAKIRDIHFMKFYGGEPLLSSQLIYDVISSKSEFDNTGHLKFAFTTNGYIDIEDDFLDFLIENRVIINFSLDGPRLIHNDARIAKDLGDTYKAVIGNICKLKEKKYPFATISVIDDRIIKYNYSLLELSKFMKKITPIYKFDPIYKLSGDDKSVYNQNIIIEQLKILIDEVFLGIKSLKVEEYVYENNIFRTIVNIVYDNQKEYVCSAHQFITLYPDNTAYTCYNLDNDEYRITDNICELSEEELENKLEFVHNKLKIENFSGEYKDIQYFGDYCPKDNNFDSFAYIYRKKMVELILDQLKKIVPGSPEHLSLLNYIIRGNNYEYMNNVG